MAIIEPQSGTTPQVIGYESGSAMIPRHKSPYESRCQGHISPSQAREGFLRPPHLAAATCSTPADPATPSGMSHARCVRSSSCARSNGNQSSLRDFQSTSALLLTTVLSEAWKPIALFGHARGPSVILEPGISRPTRLLETHPRPCVPIGNRPRFPQLTRSAALETFHAACIIFSFLWL